MRYLRIGLFCSMAILSIYATMGCDKKKKYPVVNIVPSDSLGFNNVLVGDTKKTALAFENSGAATLTVSNLSITGVDASAFSISLSVTSDQMIVSAIPFSIGPGATKVVYVDFTPATFGSHDATLTITHTDSGSVNFASPFKLPLSGNGIAASLSASGNVYFGNPYTGFITKKTIRLENIGTYPMTITDISLSDTVSGNFQIISGWDGNPVELQENSPDDTDILDLVVWFSPQTIGALSNQLLITHDAVNQASPLVINLSGTGIAPQFKVTPGGYSFGKVKLGSTVTQNFILTNLSTTDLTVSNIYVDNFRYGTQTGEFTLSGLPGFPLTLTQSQSTAFTLQFQLAADTSEGLRACDLIIQHDNLLMPSSLDSPPTLPYKFPVEIFGEAIQSRFAVEQSFTHGADYSFGNVFDNEPVMTYYTITNTGSAPYDILNIDFTGPNSGEFSFTSGYSGSSFTLQPGESHQIGIQFLPIGPFTEAGDPPIGTYLWAELNFLHNADYPIIDPNPFPVVLDAYGWNPTDGSFLWVNSWGGPDKDVAYNNCAIDNAQNIYVAGYFVGTVDFDPGPGTYNMTSSGYEDSYVVKFKWDGTLEWAQKYSNSNRDAAVSGVAVDASNDIVIGGHYIVSYTGGAPDVEGRGQGDFDCYLLKIDSVSGAPQWCRKWGGDGADEVYAVICDGNNNVYAAGVGYGTTDFDPAPNLPDGSGRDYQLRGTNSAGCYMTTYDGDGNYRFTRSWYSSGDDGVLGMKTDIANFVYVCGYYGGSIDLDPGPGSHTVTKSGATGAYVIKFDSSGQHIWSHGWGGDNDNVGNFDYCRSIDVDRNFNVYAVGRFAGTADMDPGDGVSIQTSQGEEDGFLSKFDINGNWVKSFTWGSGSSDSAEVVGVDNVGNYYIAGYFMHTKTIDFDPGAGYFPVTAYSTATMWLVKMNASDQFQWVNIYGNENGNVLPIGMAIYANKIHLNGMFDGTDVYFDPLLSAESKRSTNGNYDAFLLKLK